MRLVALVSLLAMSAAFGHPVRAADETTAAPAAQTLPAITVSTVEKRLLRDRVIVSGLVNPVETVQVAPLIEGQPIETLLADVGDWVEEGQILASLSKTTLELQRSQFQASLESAKATIAQAEAQLIEARAAADEAQRVNERTAALKQQGTASQASADQASANAIAANARVAASNQSLEAARAQVTLVEAQLANVDLQLARTEVKAPVAGEITQKRRCWGDRLLSGSANVHHDPGRCFGTFGRCGRNRSDAPVFRAEGHDGCCRFAGQVDGQHPSGRTDDRCDHAPWACPHHDRQS